MRNIILAFVLSFFCHFEEREITKETPYKKSNIFVELRV